MIDKEIEMENNQLRQSGGFKAKGRFKGLPTYSQEDLDDLNFAEIKRYDDPKQKTYGLPKFIKTKLGQKIPIFRKSSEARKLGLMKE